MNNNRNKIPIALENLTARVEAEKMREILLNKKYYFL
jgi:hypothetical protein